MQELVPHLIQDYPLVKLYSIGSDFREPDSLVGIIHGEGILRVRPHASNMPPRMTLYPVLASLGLSNNDIAECVDAKPKTVKSMLHIAFSRLHLLGRAGVSNEFVQRGVYKILKHSPAFLSAAELPVMEKVSQGWSNNDIGKQLELSGLTVKSHLENISERSHWKGREALALAAILSGEVVVQDQISLQLLQIENSL